MPEVTDREQPIRVTVELDQQDHRALEIAAAEVGMTIEQIVRIGLAGFVRRMAEREPPRVSTPMLSPTIVVDDG